MFQNTNLSMINVSSFDTSNATAMNYIFVDTPSLIQIIGLNKLSTENLRNMDNIFINCNKLETLDLSNFKTTKLASADAAFANCSKLKTIYVSQKFNISKNVSTINMFANCSNLIGGSGTTFDPTFIDGTAARIDGGVNSPGYYLNFSKTF